MYSIYIYLVSSILYPSMLYLYTVCYFSMVYIVYHIRVRCIDIYVYTDTFCVLRTCSKVYLSSCKNQIWCHMRSCWLCLLTFLFFSYPSSNKIPCINLKLSTKHVVKHLDALSSEIGATTPMSLKHGTPKSENPEVQKCCTRLVSDFCWKNPSRLNVKQCSLPWIGLPSSVVQHSHSIHHPFNLAKMGFISGFLSLDGFTCRTTSGSRSAVASAFANSLVATRC